MSYILEGLKKLEQRQQDVAELPGLLSMHGKEMPVKRGVWPYLAGLALILMIINAAAIYLWVYNPKSDKIIAQTAQKPASVVASEMQPDPSGQELKIKAVNETQPPVDASLIQKQEENSRIIEEKHLRESSSSRRKTEIQQQISVIKDHVWSGKNQPLKTPEKYLTYSQLPDIIKSNLPQMKMFLYNPDRKKRFVQLDELSLREGESMPDGLKVLQITKTAVFFRYQRYRFQMKAGEGY